MNRIVSVLIMASVCLACMQCATTTDPREGGLFSYNPKAYEQRLQERQTRLKELEAQKEEEQRKQQELQGKLSSQKALHDEVSEKVGTLEKSITHLDEVLSKSRAHSHEDEKNLVQTHIKLKALKEEVARIRAGSTPGVEAQKKEIKRLSDIVEQILKEAEALSKM